MWSKLISWMPGAKHAFRYRSGAKCGLCGRDWRDAKPFVEGHAGFLVCRRCVEALDERRRELADDVFAPLTPAQADNPYASPKTTASGGTCDLCGEPLSVDQWSFANGNGAFCGACVLAARALIDVELSKSANKHDTAT